MTLEKQGGPGRSGAPGRATLRRPVRKAEPRPEATPRKKVVRAPAQGQSEIEQPAKGPVPAAGANEGGVESGIEDTRKAAPPTMEGLLVNMEQSEGFNPLGELIRQGDGPEEYILKSRFDGEHADLIRTIAAEKMIEINGRLDEEALFKLDSNLSLAVNGNGRDQYANVITGNVGWMDDGQGQGGVGGWLRSKMSGREG